MDIDLYCKIHKYHIANDLDVDATFKPAAKKGKKYLNLTRAHRRNSAR